MNHNPHQCMPFRRRLRDSATRTWTTLTGSFLTAWWLAAWSAVRAAAGERACIPVLAAAIRRRYRQVQARRDAGLTTVEVAIITAVLLGLATALVAAITVVVNRNTANIK